MPDNNNQNNQGHTPDRAVPLTEERGLPPVNETPPMPDVKPPKQENNDTNDG